MAFQSIFSLRVNRLRGFHRYRRILLFGDFVSALSCGRGSFRASVGRFDLLWVLDFCHLRLTLVSFRALHFIWEVFFPNRRAAVFRYALTFILSLGCIVCLSLFLIRRPGS